MTEPTRPTRRRLHHEVPHWVEDDAAFFITVNGAKRGCTQLTLPEIASGVLEAARFYHDEHKWHLTLLLLMPDHFHAIMSFPRIAVMADLFKHWKRYTARTLGIQWQDGFFEHRLRNFQEEAAKYHYIRHNPVRKKLCDSPEAWPHQIRWSSEGLVIGG
jgi:putative transposase